MSEAVELFKQDGTTAGIFYCSQCRIVHRDKEEAIWCHGERLCSCGKKITQGYFQRECSDCDYKTRKSEENAKEVARFEKAAKIRASEYAGEMVYCADHYYESVEDAIDQYIEGQHPEYVWACRDEGVRKIDLDDATCNVVENMWEDAELSDLNGIEELETALNAFNEANAGIKVWYPDYSTAILTSTPND